MGDAQDAKTIRKEYWHTISGSRSMTSTMRRISIRWWRIVLTFLINWQTQTCMIRRRNSGSDQIIRFWRRILWRWIDTNLRFWPISNGRRKVGPPSGRSVIRFVFPGLQWCIAWTGWKKTNCWMWSIMRWPLQQKVCKRLSPIV